MKNIKKTTASLLRKRSAIVMILCSIVFTAAIFLLFAREKANLDTEYEDMIANSLNIHTYKNAADIDKAIESGVRAIGTAKITFGFIDSDDPREYLAQRNAVNPVYIVEYASAEDILAGALTALVPFDEEEALRRLNRGEVVVGGPCFNESDEGALLAVVVPLQEDGITTGALYTLLKAETMLPEGSESAVYQNVHSCIITGNGDIVFNTYEPRRVSNFFDDLSMYSLTQEDIRRIAAIISSPEVDSTTFERKGQAYFASAAPLQHNGWHLVSLVRGPDVLLRSATIFQDVVRTSIIAILITLSAACVIFLQLLFSKKSLEEEQQRNLELVNRFQAMFDQHSALKVLIDIETRKIVDANPAASRYFGVDRQELLGQPMGDFNLLPSQDQEEQFQSLSKGGGMFFAVPHRLANGEIRLLDVYSSIIHDNKRELIYAILYDSTDREQYREELLREKELLRTTLQSIGDGVVTTDSRGLITSLNSVAEELTGWLSGEAIGKSFVDVFVLQNEDTGEPVENPIRKVLETGLVIGLANHTELVRRQGEPIPIADSAAPIKAENGQTFGVVMVFRNVSDEKEHNRKIEFLSYHDSLTGLYNRHYLEEMMPRLNRIECFPVSVIMADVDGLKITNDVFGHRAGDALLKNVADLILRYCKEKGLVARWGGDEFVILMPGTSLEAAELLAQEMKNARVSIESSSLILSLSLGCACTADTADGSITVAMQQAEKNMYQQKLLNGKSYRNAIISTLLATLYEKSNETEEHSKRLETYCHAIGRKLQLSSKEMDELSLLALLHDIGKVAINPNILQKAGPLTPAEWEEMKRHPEIGCRIARETPELALVADLILSHHERWDGAGYPQGLQAEEIPLACRILAVVDAFDAMTNDRIYRRAMTIQDALAELQRNAGGQFDPRTAEILIEIVAGEGVKQTQSE